MRYLTTSADYAPDEDPPDPEPPKDVKDARLVGASAAVVSVKVPRDFDDSTLYDTYTTVVRLHWFWECAES
jgi:hypothetical protein